MPILNACLISTDANPGIETLTELTCEQVANNAGSSPTCFATDLGGLLLQSNPSVQINVNTETMELTFDATIHWMVANGNMTITVIDGAAAVSAEGSTRVASSGQSITLTLSSDTLRTIGPPSNPLLTDPALLAVLPLDSLPEGIETGTSTVQNTPRPTTNAPTPTTAIVNPPGDATSAPVLNATSDSTTLATATSSGVLRPVEVNTSPTPTSSILDTDGVCPNTPPDWNLPYAVQPGDTLTRISQAYDISLAELIEANCITNPDQLALGQELLLPGDNVTAPQAPAATVAPGTGASNQIESPALLTAERDVIVTGDCVLLLWDVPDAQAASLDGQGVAVTGEQEVCPAATKSYELRITYADGSQDTGEVLITVTG